MQALKRILGFGVGFGAGIAALTGATYLVSGMWLPLALSVLMAALFYFSPWITSCGLAGPMSTAVLFGVCAGWLATSGVTARKIDVSYFPSLVFTVMAILAVLFAFASVMAVPAKQRSPGWPLLTLVILVSLVAAASSSAGSAGVMSRWIMAHLGLSRTDTETAVYWVRKSIHFTYYGFVALTASVAAKRAKEPVGKAILFAFLTALSLSSFDELRQSGLADRTGSFYDVLLDLSGAATFLFLTNLRSKPTRPAVTEKTPSQPRKPPKR
ncbi:hypothetical protein OP10G_4524 [Fimbriimonas ginsengisoli Gsoil 348]|uniref:VanZ-like domain-containing protein n=1 Tax=Fimbriimonas ginsengisoli Gsoil 348 TaxID=661478 RepID=A0A068NX00_FIMGI|nr:hypothetical protein OP10G_4524 [Fimbriimonas ginsengisoli Gsoil 348]